MGVGAFLFGTQIKPDASPPLFGVLPLAWGTFVMAAGSSLVALPIGLLSAIYLSEYAPRAVRAVLKPAIELLAGVPTIVYGYLALMLVTPALRWAFEPFGARVETFNALSACVVVGVMIIPMVSSLSEDVLSAVPRALQTVPPSLRQATLALGATRWQGVRDHVLAAALPGIMTGTILGLPRAIGETAPLLMVGAAGSILRPPKGPGDRYTALPVEIYNYAKEPNADFQTVAAGGILLLLVLLLTMNASAILIRNRYARQRPA